MYQFYIYFYIIYLLTEKYHVEPFRPHSKGKRIRKCLFHLVLPLVDGDYLTIYLVHLKGHKVG